MIFEQPVNIYSQDYALKRFQSNETAAQVVRGKIAALISESELIELQNSKATMYSKLASAVLDINSLQLQFSDISSKYDTVTGQYSSLDAKVADYKAGLDGLSVNLTNLSARINNDYSTTTAMNAAIKASVDSITASVSKTYATQASLETEKAKVTNLETWKSQAELKITDSAIVSTVTSSISWSKKADKASLISQINQSAESISISASKINLNGVVTANSYFCILTDGSIKSVKGTLGGWTISSDKIQSRFAGIDAMTIHSNGYLKFGTCKISSTGGALTVKNGLHLYTNVNTDSSGFDDGTERFKIFGLGHVSSGGHLVFDSDGATVSYLSSSSRRYKNHIRDMTDNDIQNLYKLPTVFFVYKPGYLEKDSAVPIPGLYAEDVEQYLPLAARYQNGLIEDWNERAVIPYLIKAIQLQHKEIEALKRKVA